MTQTFFARAALLAAPLALAACGSEPAPEAAAPEGVGLVVENARLVLPAVDGNPGAVYFDMTNGGERNIAIGAVSVDKVGSATMHGYTDYEGYEPLMIELASPVLKPNETLTFEPGGNHVMAKDLAAGVKEGGTVEVTVTIAGGDKQSFPAKVVGPGEGESEKPEGEAKE